MFSRATGLITFVLLLTPAAWAQTRLAPTAPPDHVNVALAAWGLSSVSASSQAENFPAANTIDGVWRSWTASGFDRKWSTMGHPPHWLVIDLGDVFPIDTIILRHEGVVRDENNDVLHPANTQNFQLQRADQPQGPWRDLVEPVRGNRDNVTCHSFPLVGTRFVRVLIEKGGGQLHEVEVYAPIASLPRPLAKICSCFPPAFRKRNSQLQQLVTISLTAPNETVPITARLEMAGYPPVLVERLTPASPAKIWLLVQPGQSTSLKIFCPATISQPATLSLDGSFAEVASTFDGGTISLITSSHQDVAWMDTPEICRNFRVNNCIQPALDLMARNPDYCFSMEHMLSLREFQDLCPQRMDEVVRFIKQGRLEFGATYTEPYEGLETGEQFIRQTYFGRRWLKHSFPGCDTRVAFTPDIPASSLQTQQILKKAGIHYLLNSRFRHGYFQWFSPDGSSILVYSRGHYAEMFFQLFTRSPSIDGKIRGPGQEPAPLPQVAKAIAADMQNWASYPKQRKTPPAYMLYDCDDFSRPFDFGPLINYWNQRSPDADASVSLPQMHYGTAAGFFDALARAKPDLEKLYGERPDDWTYIHGPCHHQAVVAQRLSGVLLPAAETFCTIRCLLDGSFTAYPEKALRNAWLDTVYADHGWGGNNGHITDTIFLNKFTSASDVAREQLDLALGSIASRVNTGAVKGTPIVVFNSLSWKRSDPVTVDLPHLPFGTWHLVDSAGMEVPCQLIQGLQEINVAASRLGARASASSCASPLASADKAIDEKWLNADHDQWCSDPAQTGPQWLIIDFGQDREIFKVVIRHEGSLGAFQQEEKFNTADFQLQRGDSPQGPWTDLVPPVRDNKAVLSVHEFAPQKMRYLRLLINKANPATDNSARIFELQAFAKLPATQPQLLFVADGVPPIGCKTWYLVAGPAKPNPAAVTITADGCESAYYRIELTPGGIRSLFDKSLNCQLLRTDKFLGGEVFTMRSFGIDTENLGHTDLPTMEGFDKLSNHQPAWKLDAQASGNLRAVYCLEQKLANCTVRQRLSIYHLCKRLELDVDILDWSGEKYREFRMAMPVNTDKNEIAYEVPMGVLEVGKSEIAGVGGKLWANNNYGECSQIHPREVQNFISAQADHFGLTLSTSVAVADYIDPTSNPVGYPILQPLLLATRKSCNGEGNWYLQPGDHHYHFSLFAHAAGWRSGYRQGLQANNPMLPVFAPVPVAGAAIPPVYSFANLSSENILLSTLKKCEDDDAVVVRCYDIENKDSETDLSLFLPIRRAELTNIIEEEGKPMAVQSGMVHFPIGHCAIETLKLQPVFK